MSEIKYTVRGGTLQIKQGNNMVELHIDEIPSMITSLVTICGHRIVDLRNDLNQARDDASRLRWRDQ